MAEADKYDRARCIALPKEQEKLVEGKDEYVSKKDTSNEKTSASSLRKLVENGEEDVRDGLW